MPFQKAQTNRFFVEGDHQCCKKETESVQTGKRNEREVGDRI